MNLLICTDPYLDMIMADGISLLCNDLQVVYLHSWLKNNLGLFRHLRPIRWHQSSVLFGFLECYLLHFNNRNCTYVLFWQVDPSDIVMVRTYFLNVSFSSSSDLRGCSDKNILVRDWEIEWLYGIAGSSNFPALSFLKVVLMSNRIMELQQVPASMEF